MTLTHRAQSYRGGVPSSISTFTCSKPWTTARPQQSPAAGSKKTELERCDGMDLKSLGLKAGLKAGPLGQG